MANPDWFRVLHRALRTQQNVRSATITAADNPDLLGERVLFPSADDASATEPAKSEPLLCTPVLEHLLAGAPGTLDGLAALKPGSHSWNSALGTTEVFVETFQPPSTLVIIGAVHIAEHLVHFAQRLGFRCLVVDAREAFATAERFSHADELIVGWPGEVVRQIPLRSSTYCAFLTHDPKLDDPALAYALQVRARYIGALGSRRTHGLRCKRLLELGISETDVQRIDAPIGLDLGGRRPEEIALAIAAKLLSVRAAINS